MRNRAIVFPMLVLIAVCGHLSAYSGGKGEPNDPYLITTAEDLNDIGNHPEDFNKCFLMIDDINLADYTGTQFNIIGYYEYDGSPNNVPFTGVFDGNDHTISNFIYTATDTNCIGLFSYISGPNAEIKNLVLINPDISIAGTPVYVGSLVGRLYQGNVSGCYVNGGSIYGFCYTGGLVGANSEYGTISNCCVTGTVSGNQYTGGLVGYNVLYGTILNCYATASVFGEYYHTGGLVGNNLNGTISNCYAKGSVSGEYYTGGLVGDNDFYYGMISNCYATGSVSGITMAGGLVGHNAMWCTISNCYATGNVSADYWVGGLAGNNSDLGVINASFWNIETSGQSSSAGGTGKTTAEMQTESTFTDAGWDFIEIWDIGENQTYPFLRIHPAGDIDHDGIVNFVDLAILANHWLDM